MLLEAPREHAGGHEVSAGEALAMAERPLPAHRPWGLGLTLAAGLLSLGLLPLLRWPSTFGDRARGERHRLAGLGGLVHVDADRHARRAGPSTPARVAAYLAAGVMLGILVLTAWDGSVWQAVRGPNLWALAYAAAATVGYGAVVLDLVGHRRAVRRSLGVIGGDLYQPHALPLPTIGFTLAAVVAGALFVFWAVPMFLAGGLLRRWGHGDGRRAMLAAADAVRGRLDARDVAVPPNRVGQRLCRGEKCEAVLPPAAKFCPVCGTPARPLPPGEVPPRRVT